MGRHWVSQFEKLPLTKLERQVFAKFELDPEGLGFLALSDVLKAHKLYDEALELLSEGVSRHPNYVVARVALARDLLARGLIDASWQSLEEAPLEARSNALSHKIRLKLALLRQDSAAVEKATESLKLESSLDQETRGLLDLIRVSGSEAARKALMREFSDRGINLSLEVKANDENPHILPPKPTLKRDARQSATGVYFHIDDEKEALLRGFHVVPLSEIFQPSDVAPSSDARRGRADASIELDTVTMAELYERQGHFGKALEVYRRLLRVAPNQEHLRRKVGELTKLEREQKDQDLSIDPALVDRLEAIEIIDRQAKFYESLLAKMES